MLQSVRGSGKGVHLYRAGDGPIVGTLQMGPGFWLGGFTPNSTGYGLRTSTGDEKIRDLAVDLRDGEAKKEFVFDTRPQ